ncbi:type II toxin-antitoxin system PemK/MazF family toxin [Pseudarthrobacter sp. LT1]|uniref:type II toxin-antitoxin system PemK/MazF family toxin n=1 Tax=Pseudarthrobacter sp. LT1 TaxID=3111450 RepID=UPI002D79D479|nr:type II toxin-antitoxin system PemK/MazF family toxin [Pseudarthrobacter sp. LT1]WRT12050.1 type II toxin-antitoxin system PemK/MazF family toxin [Pseudarthrobacter sp. LT1]
MAIDLRSLGNAVRRGLRMLQKRPVAPRPVQDQRPGGNWRAAGEGVPAEAAAYPGDYRGRASVRYAPQPDGDPDPGEVVWAWVPYEEDHGKGKDRPVLLVGHNGPFLLGLMLTSRDRVPAGTSSADYVDLGSGGWDKQGRASEVRLDRILQIRPDSIRREGAVLDKARFEKVASGLRRRHGWD